ncbi:hypothetical protein [Sediminibacillus massiliensis]|nr:hypothetical protein [Sediminibacillus massiliensis]
MTDLEMIYKAHGYDSLEKLYNALRDDIISSAKEKQPIDYINESYQ